MLSWKLPQLLEGNGSHVHSLTSLAGAAGPQQTRHRPILFLPVFPKAPHYCPDHPSKRLFLPSISPHLCHTTKGCQTSLPRILFSACHSPAQEPTVTPHYLLHLIVTPLSSLQDPSRPMTIRHTCLLTTIPGIS